MKHSSRGASLEHDRGRNAVSQGGAPGKACQLQLGAGCGRRAGRRRPARSLTVSAAYLPGQPRPLSELLSAQPPRPAAAPAPPAPPAAPAAPPPPASNTSHPAAAAAAAAAAVNPNSGSNGSSSGLRPPLPPAAAAAARMRQARGGSGSLPPPHQGLGGSAVHPSSPAVSPRSPPIGGYYQIATGPGGAPLPLSQGFGLPTPDGWSPPSAQAPAAAPYKTVAEPFEAFEPGDTGFSAPATAEVVTSSSGSVMVKFTAHFSGALGDRVLACGGCRALGNWEPDAAPSLAWGEGDVWTATLELPPGTHEFKCVAIKVDPKALPVWEPGNNRRAVVARPSAAGGSLPSSSGDEIDLVLGLLSDGEDEHPEAQLVETAGGTTMVKLTTTYTAAFGEYLKVVGGPPELGAWDAGAAPALTWGEGDVWTATLELPAGEHEFKYVVVRQDGRLEWEPGENRRIHVPPPGLAAALEAARKAVAAEEAAGGNGSRPLSPPGRRLSPAEIYELQEATEQFEPWQHVEREQAQKEQADRAQQQHNDLHQQRLAAMAGSSNGSNGTAAVAKSPPAVPAKPAAPSGWREVKFTTMFKAEFGTFMKVVGGPEQLGAWEVEGAPPLQWSEGDVWSNTLLLPPGKHEFKLVVVNPNNTTTWETGENRVVEVTAAANRDSEAAGVLLAECTYGQTDATQSVWASVDDISPAETPQLLEAAPGLQQQQQHQEVPESWHSKKQRSDAAAAAAAAEQQRQAQEQHRQEAAAAEPPKPLLPLDAVVKVFKDRFTPWSSPKASPVSSTDEEAQSAAADAAAAAEQQEQQQPSAEVGDRWASILAGRRQQQGGDKPAVLFVDQQQQQPQDPGGDEEQQQGRQQQPWERHNQPPAPADGGSSRARSTLDLPEARAWRPQQQQEEGDSDVPERFASQISRIRSRSPSPEPAHEQQQQEQEQQGWDRREQQQQQPDASERFASQISSIRSRSPEPPREQQQQQRDWRREQQPDERQQQQQEGGVSERFASQIQQMRARSPEPPRAQQQQQQQEQQQQAEREPEQQPQWWQQAREQQQQQPAARQQQQEQQQLPAAREQQQQRPQRPQRRSGSWRTNWRTASPSPADAGAGDAAAPSSSSSSEGGRFANYTPRQRQQQQQESSSRGSWRSSPSASSSGSGSSIPSASSSSSEYSSASSSWDSSDEAPARTAARGDTAAAAAVEQQSQRSSWRSSSPPAGDASGDAAAASSSSSSSSGGRFSKFTSGSGWRSSSPTQEQTQQQHPSGADSAAQQQQQQQRRRFQSSWDAVEAGGGRGKGADYLFELGQSDYNTNVDAGQNSGMIDSLFAGNVLGHKSDIADGSLRGWGTRTYANIVGDYYIAPTFMDKVTMHITKNYLADQAAISKNVKVPLVLGIWGPKGCGKTFQTELAFKKLGVEAVVMSAGELESEVAGQPGRLIRERYRKASELSKVRGKLSCLVINDLDAGIGRFGNTQVTVNNQIVIGTLMNICDDPNRVSVGAGWRENDTIRRVPIIVTGNDFSTLYAPLIRDGRMEKFYWEPTREEVVNIVHQMYKDDGLSRRDIETLVATFGNQALDFFGALRASTYDSQIREWMQEVAGSKLEVADEARVKEMNRRLLTQKDLPEFEPVPLNLAMLVAEGLRLVQEQDLVNNTKLGEEYMKGVAWGDVDTGGAWSSSEESGGGIGLLG